jgi:hypothetical protein
MRLVKFKMLLCIAAATALLFAPFVLEISQHGNAYGGILFGGGGGSNGSDGTTISDTSDNTAPTAHTPEPATMLLFGAGAAGLVAYRKYRKKK